MAKLSSFSQSMTLDHEQWLAENSFHCERLRARISPEACAEYQIKNQDRFTAMGVTILGVCTGCEKAQEANMSMGKCRECNRKITLRGKGLCHRCFRVQDQSHSLEECSEEKAITHEESMVTPEKSESEQIPVMPDPADQELVVEVEDIQPSVTSEPSAEPIHQQQAMLSLLFLDERDQNLYQWLIEMAKENRRSPAQQILWILDRDKILGIGK